MRLTKSFKENLVDEIVNKKFPNSEYKKVKEKAKEYYNQWIKDNTPKGWEKYKKLMHMSYYVEVLNRTIKIDDAYPSLDGENRFWLTSTKGGNGYSKKRYVVAEKDLKPAKKIDEWNKKRDDFHDSIYGVIMQYTTKKKLLEDIPELEEFFEAETVGTALVPVETINKIKDVFK